MQKEEKKYPEQKKEEKIIKRLFEVPVKAVLLKDDKVLVLKRATKRKKGDNRWAGKYDLPGGATEYGETVEEALKREVKEETDLDVEVGPVIQIYESEIEYYLDEERKQKMKVYIKGIRIIAFYKSGEVKLNDEHESFEWLSFDDAIKRFDVKDDFEKNKRLSVEKAREYLKNQNSLNSWKRCQADFENYKKSQAKQQEEFRKYAKMDVIEQILPVLDNFEASLAHVPEKSKKNGWVEGITYIKKQLEDVLKNNNVEEIVVKVGDKFDPALHEAVAGDGEKISKVLQKGYRLNGKMIRAARVALEIPKDSVKTRIYQSK